MSKQIQFVSKDEWRQLQEDCIKKQLQYLQKNSPYYSSILNQSTIDVNHIKDIQHIQQLPFTQKEDVQAAFNKFLCVQKNEIAEYVCTSGTLGEPLYIALTKKDIERLAKNEAFSYEMMNLQSHDIVQLLLTLDKMFMAGIAYYMGLQQKNISVIRTGPGAAAMQWSTTMKLNTTTWVAVPSFVYKLINYAQANNIDVNNSNVKKILCIGENIRDEHGNPNALATKIQSVWDVQLYSTYASTEMQTAFTECAHANGVHHQPDKIFFEIIDDEGNVLPASTYGELVITTLGVEGMPLLRYKTGDICCYYDTPCACGRTTMRLSPILGRKKHMVKYKGTTIYPQAIHQILQNEYNIIDYVVVINSDEIGNDTIKILIHVKENTPIYIEALQRKMKDILRVTPDINSIDAIEINKWLFPNENRKPIRWVDCR